MRNENFYVVQGWMANELELSGNELVCYAIIYAATQGGQTLFRESRRYLADWMNVTLPTVDKTLKTLAEKNLIEKHVEVINGVTFNTYNTTLLDFMGGKDSLGGGSKDSLPHINNGEEIKEKEKNTTKKKELFEECWVAYRRKGSKKKALEYWNKLSDEEKEHMVLPHIKAYVSTRDLSYQKDFERYLRDKTFATIIVQGNNVVYDPTRIENSQDKTYLPETSISFRWSDDFKCYVYIGYWNGFIPDGYTDDNRPDGARVMLSNGRGTIVWNKQKKRWEGE